MRNTTRLAVGVCAYNTSTYNYICAYCVHELYVWLFFGGYAWINNTRDPLCVVGDEIVRQRWSQLPLGYLIPEAVHRSWRGRDSNHPWFRTYGQFLTFSLIKIYSEWLNRDLLKSTVWLLQQKKKKNSKKNAFSSNHIQKYQMPIKKHQVPKNSKKWSPKKGPRGVIASVTNFESNGTEGYSRSASRSTASV